ncbi:Ribosomal RNA large subunit methyltransferase H [bioreactor metagenome]|uniref:Ribosomal RNA large subunit methyltransferase H n=1 Tax=bioreactor metagenome TaxID=1076179 RepID=A0A644TIL0_9ZZZZ|nr:23S rRNA (pseudouridine(1915)-N(3))-methyltransferase RlmH [Bacteroidales bacterium]MEA5099627.1 23S rRNA (pseudouridine(1915)-N(3))-methyltransferase RlmH [Bacteroidales bacterium]
MNIKLIFVGKTEEKYLQEGIEIYEKRLKNYINFETIVIPSLKDTKNLSPQIVKEKEGELILKQVSKYDKIILFDEKGLEFTSMDYSVFLQKHMNAGVKNLCFVVGGAFGFSDEVYKKADQKVALSKMTFSHQMIRLLIVEQIYRAFTILKNEPYHNQ